MHSHRSASRALALTASIVLLITDAQAEMNAPLSIHIARLERWLDQNAPWPARQERPAVQIISSEVAASLSGRSTRDSGLIPRGFYLEHTETIYLVEPWSAENPQDVSVLLHELAHHRQATAGHWYCDGAKELSAYELQEAWLNARGLDGNINWIAVHLEAGCAPRDIHPG